MTRDQARAIALFVSAGWPGSRLSETSVELWADALEDLDYAIAQRAARLMLQEVPAFPSVAALRQRAEQIAERDATAQRPQLMLVHSDLRTPEERRQSAGWQALGDVAAKLRRRTGGKHAP